MNGNVVFDLVVLAGLAIIVWQVRSLANAGAGQDGNREGLKRMAEEFERAARLTRDEFEKARAAADDRTRALREELASNLAQSRREDAARAEALRAAVDGAMANHAKEQGETQKRVADANGLVVSGLTQQVSALTQTSEQRLTEMRETLGARLTQFESKQIDQGHKLGATLNESLARVSLENEQRGEKLREQVRAELATMRAENEAKLDQIRRTVDEQLQSTLEKRIGESFNLVSEQLKSVAMGLGEMQQLASGVGDLKRVLTNVKPRGIWGEAQLEALLVDFLAPDQLERNVKPRPGASEVVEFAIKLPRGAGRGGHYYLPLDSKFPREDFERLVLASEAADAEALKSASEGLAKAVKKCAADIKMKYIEPPYTTEYAIMFLPSEALYAEVARQPGLLDAVIRDTRVVIAGPSTLAALLSTFRMAFQSLRIQEQAGDIAQILQRVQSEFGKFDAAVATALKRATSTVNSLESLQTRQKQMGRALKGVELLRAESRVDATRMLLEFEAGEANDAEPADEEDDAA